MTNFQYDKYVKVTDWSQYVSGKSSTGGCYSFTTKFFPNEDASLFEVKYYTSADIDYCDVCGSFQTCSRCNSYINGECCSGYETMTQEEVVEYLESVQSDENFEITFVGLEDE